MTPKAVVAQSFEAIAYATFHCFNHSQLRGSNHRASSGRGPLLCHDHHFRYRCMTQTKWPPANPAVRGRGWYDQGSASHFSLSRAADHAKPALPQFRR